MRVVAAILLLTACTQAPSMKSRPSVAAAVEAAMSGYHAASARRDFPGASAFFLDSPDFAVLANGRAMNVSEWSDAQREYYSASRVLSGGWSGLKVTILNASAAVVTGVRDQVTVTTNGARWRTTGTATWTWVWRNGRWSIIHINTNSKVDSLP